MKILLELAFDGAAYCGWQAQKDGNTIQQRLTDAARSLFGYDCDITGCSRTDSGVHANGFCATVSKRGEKGIETTVPVSSVPRAINRFLPDDISVISAYAVPDTFHARYDVVSKEYIYKILTRAERDPFYVGRCWHYPRTLDVAAMNEAAKRFYGKHDFRAFMAQGSKIENTERTVFSADVTRDCDFVVFKVSADGFLYNMVRIMTGTLTDVGEGRITPGIIETIINGRDRKNAGMTAPACGLYLNSVEYRDLSNF